MRWILVGRLGLFALIGVGIVPDATAQTPVARTKTTPADYRYDPAVCGYGDFGAPFDGSSMRAMPPAIVPTTWLVVPRASKADEEQLLTRFALETDAPLPTAAKSASGGAQPSAIEKDAAPVAWLAVESRDPNDALLAFTTITSESDDVRMAQLTGAEFLFVNSEGFAGDPNRLGFRGVPVLLKKGANRLFVAGIRGSFTLELWKPATRIVVGTWDAAWPGYGMSYDAFEDTMVTYPVFHASVDGVETLLMWSGHGVPADGVSSPKRTQWHQGGSLAPLGMLLCGHEWRSTDGWIEPSSRRPAQSPPTAEVGVVEFRTNEDESMPLVTLRRDLTQRRELDDVFRARDAASRRKSLIAKRYFPVVLVYGTQGTPEETAALLALARFDQELSWARTRGTPLVVSDTQFHIARSAQDEGRSATPLHVRDAQVVLYGNADTNSAWSSIVPPDLGMDVRRGGVTRGATRIEGDDLFGWFICATKDKDRAQTNAVMFSTGVRGARSGQLVHPFDHGLAPIDDAVFRRDESAPAGRTALLFTRR